MDAGARGADAQAIDDFKALASGPAIIEGGRNKPGLMASAVSAIARGAAMLTILGGATAGVAGVVKGVDALQTAYNSAFHAVPPKGEGVYGKLVADMQAEIDAFIGPGRIVIYDRSAPLDWESKRVAAHLGVKSKTAAEYPNIKGGGAYAGWQGKVCIVMGPDPQAPAGKEFNRLQENSVELGDVSHVEATRATLGHEVSHCLLNILYGAEVGKNEGRADVFGNLMVMRVGNSKDYLPLLLASRELDEYTVKDIDNYATSASLRWLLERSSDPEFVSKVRNATLAELAEIARSAPALDAIPERITRLRDAVYDSSSKGRYYVVPVEEGFVMANKWDYLRANSDVSEFAHMVALSDYLSSDPATRKVPGALVLDHAASAKAVIAMAEGGDPRAAKVADALGVTVPRHVTNLAPARYKAHEVTGQLVEFDRSSVTVSFDKYGRHFRLQEVGSGKALAAGIVGQGITKTFDAPTHTSDLARDAAAFKF